MSTEHNTENQTREFDKYHRKLSRYIRDKEGLTRDNLVSMEKRRTFFGFITAIFPLFSIKNILQNYAAKKGTLYFVLHPTSKYRAGEEIVLPNLKRFFGALFKDLWSWRSNREGLLIRQHNMGYAQSLLLHLDAKRYGHRPLPISFAQDVYDQLQIKRQRREFDSYYELLKSIFRKTKDPTIDKEQAELQCKADYLDYLAEETVRDEFVRGRYYGFEGNIAQETQSSAALIWERLKSTPVGSVPLDLDHSSEESELTLSHTSELIRPISAFTHPQNNNLIELSSLVRFGDRCMHMRFSEETYQDYVIQGTDAETESLVGKDEQILADGWYQFIIVQDRVRQEPVIRYYPCGDKLEGTPFVNQTPSRNASTVEDEGYLIQAPANQYLSYEKYIAHSELAGGLPVNAAGAFMIKGGKLRVIEDSSGHYTRSVDDPLAHLALKFSCDLFQHYGADTNDVILERWEPYHGIDKLCKKTAGMLTQFFESEELKERGISPQLAELRSTEPGKKTPIQVLRKLN